MIRPIDTSTLYVQSQNASKEVQTQKMAPTLQQEAFAVSMEKERVKERAQVIKSEKQDEVKNEKQKSNQQQNEKKKKNDKKNDPNEVEKREIKADTEKSSVIDIKL